ncbi:MAG: hypothetical protein HRT57_03065 [Crocinitomicaceae bacterium]|nr:hypothetical protein [Crocinitomicaceae bacterium]
MGLYVIIFYQSQRLCNGYIYYTDYYCKATISKFGVRFTANNTCGRKFGEEQGSMEYSYDMVAKYKVGFYYYNSDKWNLRPEK